MRTIVKHFVTDFDEYIVFYDDDEYTIERVMPEPYDNEYVASSESLKAIEAYEMFLRFHEITYNF